MNPVEPLEAAAWRLLKESKVLEHLRQVGEPKVHGSLELRTMAWPEIDIYVGVPKPTMDDVCATLTQLANCVAMRDVHIINQVDFPKRYATGGIMIIDVGIEWEKAEWKLDVALMPAEWLANAMSFNTKLLAEMDDEKRRRIVAIKQRAVESPWYRRKNWAYIERGNYFYSNDIYRAVLDGKAATYEEFCTLIRSARNIELP
jgi:hypothetical protein